MALRALERCMRAIYDKESVVSKIVHPVDPIVTGGAAGAILGDMRLHKGGVVLGVAGGAGRLVVILHI